jgi:hypothetical protein
MDSVTEGSFRIFAKILIKERKSAATITSIVVIKVQRRGIVYTPANHGNKSKRSGLPASFHLLEELVVMLQHPAARFSLD